MENLVNFLNVLALPYRCVSLSICDVGLEPDHNGLKCAKNKLYKKSCCSVSYLVFSVS